ncbi:MAG: MFS transporter [Bacteroidetes bacterium]|nr:MFS transporter [Bacteroidota bacterium]MBK9401785.1 MFS transporter [Bacteroidota bacterium]
MSLQKSPFNLVVFAAGLGFFIDAFDLFLFNIYRIPSLKDLGLSGKDLTRTGENILAIQMAGMIVGGIITGIIGDRKGRVYVLYGSILLYSISNIANAFVEDTTSYAVIRFLAGAGLAGELGAGITLVSESMTIERRGYGTIMVATLGAMGAVTAGLIGNVVPWRIAFFAAGCIGLLLLLLRMSTIEPEMFSKRTSADGIMRGSFPLLFSNRKRSLTYLACILTGIPIWYSVGLLITLSPEIAALKNIEGLQLATCFILFQIGITVGDLSSGILSQLLRTRKKVMIAYMLFALASTLFHFILISNSSGIYLTSLLMGTGCGYLSVFVTATAEHFGTNLRVLITATVTNFMRGAVTLLVPLHLWLESYFRIDLIQSLAITGGIVWSLALIAVFYLPETYGKNLDFIEE